jgi:hypothetical protein
LLQEDSCPGRPAPEAGVVGLLKHRHPLPAAEQVAGDDIPPLVEGLESLPLGRAHPHHLAGVGAGHRVAAAPEGDEAVPAHLTHLLPAAHEAGGRQGSQAALLLLETVDGPLLGRPMHLMVQLFLETGQLLAEVIEVPEAAPLDEVLLQVVEGPLDFALRARVPYPGRHRLHPVVTAQLQETGVPPSHPRPGVQDEGPVVVHQQLLGGAAEVMKPLFDRLEGRGLAGVQTGPEALAPAVAQGQGEHHYPPQFTAYLQCIGRPVELALLPRPGLESKRDSRVRSFSFDPCQVSVKGRPGTLVPSLSELPQDAGPNEPLPLHLPDEVLVGDQLGVHPRRPAVLRGMV